jgi:hypothetical protein
MFTQQFEFYVNIILATIHVRSSVSCIAYTAIEY